jgi:hypothetical protein
LTLCTKNDKKKFFKHSFLNIETSTTPFVVLCTGDEDGTLVDDVIVENDNLSKPEYHSEGI